MRGSLMPLAKGLNTSRRNAGTSINYELLPTQLLQDDILTTAPHSYVYHPIVPYNPQMKVALMAYRKHWLLHYSYTS